MSSFNPTDVNLNTADPRDVICYLQTSQNDYSGSLGAHISAVFVILFLSTATTLLPVASAHSRRVKVPLYFYLFARYFGAGVIVATAFVHLLDPAYSEIGPQSCVGMTGNWALYSWPPAIAMSTAILVFLMDFAAERYVEIKFHLVGGHVNVDPLTSDVDPELAQVETDPHITHQFLHSGDQQDLSEQVERAQAKTASTKESISSESVELKQRMTEIAFRQQIAAFLVLEFGVIFHSVIIGLALGTAGSEFNTLYPVIVFHQAFEGLGIGARLSAIPFPSRFRRLPYWLCIGYGISTPISIAVGLGLRTTYNSGSFTANVVSGILDAMSAGILMYTGLVELLARDFLFNPERTKDNKQLTFMIVSVLLGAGIMALLGKWA